MKIAISVILMVGGLYVLIFRIVGMHGHIRFRPHMLEDWIFAGILVICFGIPVLLLIKWYIGYRRRYHT